MNQATRVMIVDDHPMVAQGIQAILETYDDIQVIACVTSGEAALDLIKDITPDVVLMDLNMPGIGGCRPRNKFLNKPIKPVF